MDIASLEKNIIPLGLFDHIENKTNVILLLFSNFIIFLDFA